MAAKPVADSGKHEVNQTRMALTAILLAALKEKLKAEADSQERLSTGEIILQGLNIALGLQGIDGLSISTYAWE